MARKDGYWSGYGDYRYGARKKPVTLARVFAGEERKQIVRGIVDIISVWNSSPFENEGAARAGIRAAMCMRGHSWSVAEAEAASLLTASFLKIGAQRPSWEQGQREYTTPEENCRWCGCDIAADLMTGRASRYCSEVCARSALRYRDMQQRRFADQTYTDAWHALQRTQHEPIPCAHCATPFRPDAKERKFCSNDCAKAAIYRIPERSCKRCSTVFKPQNQDIVYCTWACFNEDRTLKVDRICKHCGITFRPPTNNPGNYCSRKCLGADRANWRFDRVCVFCDAPFVAASMKATNCSPVCADTMSKKKRGVWRPNKLSRVVFDHLFTKPINTTAAEHRFNFVCLPVRSPLTAEIFDEWFREAA
ncbi:hypothetical protein MRS76_19295 [Rhizobiaceae bacterium n13]|uniref:hypothetical protein n=1 Tax=Ferirhizobium litorale TaxID=2927786 RepID=UPI0024B2C72A|nr:hypothetical protein [Fererhizobium litorale]MDI7864098.1 hypothetical protein [Fererhizobium litorale]